MRLHPLISLAGPNRHPALAALTLCAGVLVFSAQDWIIKSVSSIYPVHEAIVIRGVVALPILLAIVMAQGSFRDIISPRAKWLMLRGLIMMGSYTAYYLAFPSMPLANVVALWFIAPLLIVALSGPTLGEKVTPKRWMGAAVGFAGVLIMVRPLTGAFSFASLLPLAGALTYAAAQLMARRMSATASAPVMSFHQNLAYLMVAGVIALLVGGGQFGGSGDPSLEFFFRSWVMPTGRDLFLLAACGPIAAAGMVLLTQAYRMADANFVTSFEYSGIIWATLGGYVFWQEVPDRFTLVGSALIVGSGLYVLRGAQPASVVCADRA